MFPYIFVFEKYWLIPRLIALDHSSRSRSPVRRERSPVREDRSQSPRYRSPERKNSSPSAKVRNDSPTYDEGNQQKDRGSMSPENGRLAAQQDGSDYSDDPRRSRSRSPASPKTNGSGRRGSPRDDRSPIDDEDTRHSPRGSESP